MEHAFTYLLAFYSKLSLKALECKSGSRTAKLRQTSLDPLHICCRIEHVFAGYVKPCLRPMLQSHKLINWIILKINRPVSLTAAFCFERFQDIFLFRQF